jgi:hypothetical protein
LSEGDLLHKGIAAQSWKVVGAAVRGPSHVRTGQPCQDAFEFAVSGDWLAAAVCDGAGSARRGGEGASLLASTVIRHLTQAVEAGDEGLLDRLEDIVAGAIEDARGAIEDPDDPEVLRAHHATLVGVLASPAGGCFFQIGDGAAATDMGGDGEPWLDCVVSQPENGEYANETYFFTLPTWREHLHLTRFSAASRLVLMSDGVSGFAMLTDCVAPDLRFLGPVSRYLDSAEAETGARALAATLDDTRAHEVSSDDKTLVWACVNGGAGS